MHNNLDIVIIGGGLVGFCLALSLRDTGMRVAVVEATTDESRSKSAASNRALALSYGTTKMLDKLSIWQKIRHKATPIKQIHISDQGYFAKSRLSADKEGVEALGYVITANIIERAVLSQAQQTKIPIICPGRLVGLVVDKNQAHIVLKVGDKSINIATKLIVGADGGNSSVRKLLQITQSHFDYQQKAIITVVKPTLGHNNIAFERFTATGPLALLPTANNYSVIWTHANAQADKLLTGSDAKFITALQQCFGYRMGEFKLLAPRLAIPLSLIKADTIIASRGVLIGNAAHQLHPVAGQGFNLSLRDVVSLSAMLIQQSQDKKDIGCVEFLQKYSSARQSDHNKIVNFTDGIVKIFSNNIFPFAVSRGLGLILLDHINSAKSYLARQAMGLNNPS